VTITNPLWQEGGPQTDEQLRKLLVDILNTQGVIIQRLDDQEDHNKTLSLQFQEHKASTDAHNMLTAYPARDPDGHRRAHEDMIEDIAERRRLRRAIQEKTISALVWSLLLVLGISVWQYLLSQVKGNH